MPTKPKRPVKRGASVGLADYAMPAKVDVKAQRRQEAEEALRTLTRAQEHRGNRKLMSDVRALASEHASKMARIAKR